MTEGANTADASARLIVRTPQEMVDEASKFLSICAELCGNWQACPRAMALGNNSNNSLYDSNDWQHHKYSVQWFASEKWHSKQGKIQSCQSVVWGEGIPPLTATLCLRQQDVLEGGLHRADVLLQ